MKLNKIIIAGLCLAAMASCQKENAVSDNVKNFSFTVVSELPQGDDSKAAIVNNKPVFQAGDEITVWDGTTNNKFTTAEGGSSATFNGTAADGAAAYTVISPYQENLEINGSVITYEIPSVQVATKGSCDPKALFSAGKVVKLDGSVALKNMSGFIKVTVPDGISVREIQVAGGKACNTAICGKFTFNVNEGKVTGLVTGTTSEIITLVPAAGSEFIEAGDYYIAVRVKDYLGLNIAYVNENNILCKRQTGNTVDVQVNHVMPAGSLDANYTPVSGACFLRTSGDEVQFTGRVKKIAGGSGSATEVDNKIEKIVFKSHTLYNQGYKTSAALLSSGKGTVECHGYLSGTTFYVCTEAAAFNLQAGCGGLFRDFAALKEVVFDNVKTTETNTTFEMMFRNDYALESVDFGNCDFSAVTNMSFMFSDSRMQDAYYLKALKKVNFGKTYTAKVTNFKGVFCGCTWMEELKLGPNFTVNHLADVSMCNQMFTDTAKESNAAAGADPNAKCHLYMTQEQYNDLRLSGGTGKLANSNLNPARFYFVPVTE